MNKMIPLELKFPHHTVILEPELQRVRVLFADGSEAHAIPHDTPEYQYHADYKATGDRMEYCWSHDLMHVLLAEIFLQGPSPALWYAAHNMPADERTEAEERFVQNFQRTYMHGDLDPGECPR